MPSKNKDFGFCQILPWTWYGKLAGSHAFTMWPFKILGCSPEVCLEEADSIDIEEKTAIVLCAKVFILQREQLSQISENTVAFSFYFLWRARYTHSTLMALQRQLDKAI